MSRKGRAALPLYEAALRRHLGRGAAASFNPALKLGRQAVALGLSTLDLALIHERALMGQALPPVRSFAARRRVVARASAFFTQAIVPIEQTHRSALETNVHLRRLNRLLIRRTRELAALNRTLKAEIARRHDVEDALRQSEQHSTRLLEKSRRMQEQLRVLSRSILSVQEDERKRISRELHDVIAQMLTGINVRLAALKKDAAVSNKGFSRKIWRTQQLVARSVDIVHQFARELRPALLDDLGLIPALHSFMKSFAEATGIRVRLTAFAGVETLSISARTALYRVAQEALSNVAQHAHAGRVDVRIRSVPDFVRMHVKDDGRAFDVERAWHARDGRHLGLIGMRERVEMVGGTFAIESAPGRGTIVRVRIPCKDGAKEPQRP